MLRLDGPVVSRVEMNQLTGAVPLQWAASHDSLGVVADTALVPGPAGINVGCLGAYGARGPGAYRAGRAIVLEGIAGRVAPAWPAGAPKATWSLDVHVPVGCTVRANLPAAGRSRQGAWRTYSFASRRPLDADALRIEVRPPRGASGARSARR